VKFKDEFLLLVLAECSALRVQFEVVIARAWLTFQRTKKLIENLLVHAVYPRMKGTDIL
jgi:hypothetical protein